MNRVWASLAILELVLAISASTADAAAPASFTCSGGTSSSMSTIPAGTYANVTVTGICHILGAVTGPIVNGTQSFTNCTNPGGPVDVLGNLTVAPGAFLDAGSCAPTITVGGNVLVGSGSTVSETVTSTNGLIACPT
jgi:hypothetical protein